MLQKDRKIAKKGVERWNPSLASGNLKKTEEG